MSFKSTAFIASACAGAAGLAWYLADSDSGPRRRQTAVRRLTRRDDLAGSVPAPMIPGVTDVTPVSDVDTLDMEVDGAGHGAVWIPEDAFEESHQ